MIEIHFRALDSLGMVTQWVDLVEDENAVKDRIFEVHDKFGPENVIHTTRKIELAPKE